MEQALTRHKIISRLIALIILPLAVGIVSAALSGDAMLKYGRMNQPALAPPAIVFPIAWTILYVLMGVGSYFLMMAKPADAEGSKSRMLALIIYFVQLAFNFAWSLFFFNGQMYYFAFAWLLVLWAMIILLIVKSTHVSIVAAVIFISYLLWCTFAAYLNLMVAILN